MKFALYLLPLLFIACKKTEPYPEPPIVAPVRVTAMDINSPVIDSRAAFTYDVHGRVSEMILYAGTNPVVSPSDSILYIRFGYSSTAMEPPSVADVRDALASGVLSHQRHHFQFLGGQLLRDSVRFENGDYNILQFNWNANYSETVLTTRLFTGGAQYAAIYDTLQFTNGNLTVARRNAFGAYKRTVQTFDVASNPLNDLNVAPAFLALGSAGDPAMSNQTAWFPYNRSNLLTRGESSQASGPVNMNQTFTNTYDGNGYATSRIYTLSGAVQDTLYFRF